MVSNMILKELNRRFQKVYDTRSAFFDPIYVAATYLDPRYWLALSREQIFEAKRAIVSFVTQYWKTILIAAFMSFELCT